MARHISAKVLSGSSAIFMDGMDHEAFLEEEFEPYACEALPNIPDIDLDAVFRSGYPAEADMGNLHLLL